MTRFHHLAPALPGICAAFVLTACQPASPVAEAGQPAARTAAVTSGHAAPLPKVIARSCQGCHAVRLHLPSPHPAAPGFADIANLEGLTRSTFAAFLREAHNYPEEMKMTLTPQEVEDIVAYVLTLRRPNYRPMA